MQIALAGIIHTGQTGAERQCLPCTHPPHVRLPSGNVVVLKLLTRLPVVVIAIAITTVVPILVLHTYIIDTVHLLWLTPG